MMQKIKKEQVIVELKKLIEQFETGTFNGVIVVSQDKKGFMIAEKGLAEDRIGALDAIIYSISTEPNLESRKWMIEKLQERAYYIINLIGGKKK